VIDPAELQIVLRVVTGWLGRRARVAYLIEEKLASAALAWWTSVRPTDDDRRRLAARAYRQPAPLSRGALCAPFSCNETRMLARSRINRRRRPTHTLERRAFFILARSAVRS